MILKELVGYKGAKELTVAELTMLLSKHGYVVNRGSFSIVLAPPGKNFVYRCWTEDSGFEAYYKLLKSSDLKQYAYVPKFLGEKRSLKLNLKNEDREVNVQRVEKLSDDYPAERMSFARLMINAINSKAPRLKLEDMIVDTLGSDSLKKYPLITDFIYDFSRLVDQNLSNDIGGSNVLWSTERNCPVITDPYYISASSRTLSRKIL